MLSTQTLLSLDTRRYSALCRRILEEYAQTATFVIDAVEYTEADVPTLLRDWCTNDVIQRTRNFTVVRDGVEILGFHDHPREFWAADTELAFVVRLASEKILRYERPRARTPREAAEARTNAFWSVGCLLAVGVIVSGLVAVALVLWRVAAR